MTAVEMGAKVAANIKQGKKNYVAKGAAIALGTDLAIRTISSGYAIKKLGKDTFINSTKATINTIGKGKYAALVAAGLAVTAAIGAGIGKLIENHKSKNEQAQ